MRGRARRRREAEEAAAVARTTAFAAIAVDGSLELIWRTETFPLTLIGVEVFHVSKERKPHRG